MELPESSSPKAARILAATADLLRSRGARGFTVADVAQRAHVGKGTVYLYWDSKEDLLIGLIVREFLDLADELVAALRADHELARPSRLCRLLLRAPRRYPLVHALQSHDDLLGVLADDPRSTRLLNALGPSAVLLAVLPIWRAHGLVRTDLDLVEQGYVLHAIMTGFAAVADESRYATADPAATLAVAVTFLVETKHTMPVELESAAAGLIALLDDSRRAAFAIIQRVIAPGP